MILKEAKKDLALRRRNVRETMALIDANPDTDLFDAQLLDLRAEVDRLSALVRSLTPPAASMVIAVDPAMIASGYAFRDPARPDAIFPGALIGVENVRLALCDMVAYAPAGATVYLAIEYPTWKGKGTDAVRAAANCWIRALKAAFPRRLKVRKVTPQTWMGAMIPGYRKLDKNAGERPADLYVPLALSLTTEMALDENAAAAVCILTWAEARIAAGDFNAPKKPKAEG